MKIGIPNTLFAAYHLPYWRKFFDYLGIELLISDDSCKETIDIGSKSIPHEFCIPVKALLGHVVNLTLKKADLIFIPRMIGKGNREFFCPKLIGLPEIVKYALRLDETVILSPEVVCNGVYLQMMNYPSFKMMPKSKLHQAHLQAEQYWKQTLARCRQECLTIPQAASDSKAAPKNGAPKLGLLGYAYTLYDPFISKGIVEKLTALGSKVYTWEMLDSAVIESKLKGLGRPMFWNFSRFLLGAGLHFLAAPEFDGVIYVTPFSCGPDAITTKLLSLEAAVRKKPFLQITLDEHAEDSHLKTRLEAFIDMLTIQKEGMADEGNFPIPRSGTGL
jgi:predicted nucleotide-binding protein (sugar kinase/HSP70/actin superfamily)